MKYEIEKIKNTIICSDALETLRKFPDECVDVVITSPPYYALRNYQVEGQIGLEPSFEEYLNKLLEIFKEVKRVLKKTGSFWLNMGDVYCSPPAGNTYISKANKGIDEVFVRKMKMNEGASVFLSSTDSARMYHNPNAKNSRMKITSRFRQKCMMMMPERIALKMIDEQGWILRQKIIWAKQIMLNKEKRTIGSVMPTSVKDRFNMSWEYLYHFVKNKKYYFDLDAVRIPPQTINLNQKRYNEVPENYGKKKIQDLPDKGKGLNRWTSGTPNYIYQVGKNIPTVWQINPEPHNFKKELGVEIDHFAVFPQLLCEIPIKASCPENGIVLDPFCGSGTALLIAKKLGRNYIGIDLNPNYCEIAKRRLLQVQPFLFCEKDVLKSIIKK